MRVDRQTTQNERQKPVELVGLIPAGGLAARISPLPCSKELFPIGFRLGGGGALHPKPVCLYLLEKMQIAGVERVYFVLRPGKWDIPAYLQNGDMLGMRLAYLIMQHPYGAPFTLDEAFGFVRDAHIAFGFPDIIFSGDQVYERLYQRLQATQSDIVLGLFPTRPGQKADMVKVDDDGRVLAIELKPDTTDLAYAWITAVWSPEFTGLMHAMVEKEINAYNTPGSSLPQELYIGHVIAAAVDQGLEVQAEIFDGHYFYDIGTPEGLQDASRVYGGK